MGTKVDLPDDTGKFIDNPIKPEDPSLEMLLTEITPENQHCEILTGDSVGSET
jgi:hypothetical protein